MTCSVVDCSQRATVKGYCNKHYQRWIRHGDPVAGGTSYGDPLRFFNETVLTYDGDECLIWPYARIPDGYGQVKIEGKMRSVHRLACIEINGPPPSPLHEAAHNCGKGHEGCVSKRHLRWATTAENQADKLAHGTLVRGERHPQSKLKEVDVLAIRGARRRGVSAETLAARFRVTQRTIFQIDRRQTWGWLEDAPKIEAARKGQRR